MSENRIAVIVPTYNRKDLVFETVRSILQQIVRAGWNFEVIVVDDGSTDGTGEAFQAASFPHDRVTYLYQENRERGAARNLGARHGISVSGASWLLFFDSDDLLLEGAFDSYVERLLSDPNAIGGLKDVSAVYGKIETWYGAERQTAIQKKIHYPEGNVSEVFVERTFLPIGATLVKADTFTSVGGFSEIRAMSGSEDFHFLFRVALRGRVLFAPIVANLYRQHTSNTHPENYLISTDLAISELETEVRMAWPPKKADEIFARLSLLGKLWQAGA
jgi:glycosyltransferase involved in cell wall biosynthesis